MRKLLFIPIIALVFLLMPEDTTANWGARKAFGTWTTNTVAGTPVKLYHTNIWVTSATVVGMKAARTANTGSVYFGPTSGNDTQFHVLTTGSEAVITSGDQSQFDLSQWYLDVVTDDDGIAVTFE